jgi:heptosyltransferase-2
VNPPQQQILIIFLAGIGNMILFLPTLKAIRDKYPDAKIIFWAKEMVIYEMMGNNGLIDEIWPYYNRKFKNLFRQLSVYFKLRKKRYDLVINAFPSLGYKICLFTLGLKGEIKLGYKMNDTTDRCYTHLLDYNVKEHECDTHFKIALFLDKQAVKGFPDFHLGAEEKKFAQQYLIEQNIATNRVIIGVHPGCKEFARNKRWAPEKFARVADIISEKYNAVIIFLGGKDEVSLSEEVVRYTNTSTPFSLVGKATIRQSAAVIKKCNLFISNDSGLMHLASAVGTPLIAIFGPTNLDRCGPLGANSVIVRKQTACAPCAETPFSMEQCENRICLDRISVNEVVAAADKILSNNLVAGKSAG